jgi:hypothetical protein
MLALDSCQIGEGLEIALLGEGGQAVVKMMSHPLIGTIACKIWLGRGVRSADKEAKVQLQLRHRNIVAILAHCAPSAPGQACGLAMEYLRLGNMEKCVL